MPAALQRIVGACALALFALACHDVRVTPMAKPGEIGIYDDLFSVAVVNDQMIIAVGYYGAIYRSRDAGATWEKRDSGTLKSLYGVSMADEKRGWAVGQGGLILRTQDGGDTWQIQPNLKETEGSQLFSVEALDANTAWAVGEWGSRIFTDDGGKTWQDFSLLITETHPQFVWLPPVDQDRVRHGEKVYEDVSLNDVNCLPPKSTHCWIAGEFGYTFYSDTSGLKWERGAIVGDIKPEPVVLDYNVTRLKPEDIEKLKEFAKRIEPETHLNVEIEPRANEKELTNFIKGTDPTPLFEILDARLSAVRSVIEDAGILSDRIRVRGTPPWDYEDFQKDDPGFLKRYLDGRKAAQPGVDVRVAQNPYLFTVRFEDEQHGVVSALGGLILSSTDGGRTWSYQKTARRQALFSVAVDGSRAIAVGEKGFVQVSNDFGATWQTPKEGFPSIFTFMRDVDFSPSGNLGVIVGQTGLVLKSEDKGATWTQVLPPPNREVSASM
ncbi:MAG TPA: YCF48-related protein [Myxococcota bacterium]|nr:YCF48-related protein [Myxococcota bacterium]